MRSARRNNQGCIRVEGILCLANNRHPIAFLDTNKLVQIMMNFHPYLFSRLKGHVDQLVMITTITNMTKFGILFGRSFKILFVENSFWHLESKKEFYYPQIEIANGISNQQ